MNVTNMLSPTFAHVESELLDIILTRSKVGRVLSKTTTESLQNRLKLAL